MLVWYEQVSRQGQKFVNSFAHSLLFAYVKLQAHEVLLVRATEEMTSAIVAKWEWDVTVDGPSEPAFWVSYGLRLEVPYPRFVHS